MNHFFKIGNIVALNEAFLTFFLGKNAEETPLKVIDLKTYGNIEVIEVQYPSGNLSEVLPKHLKLIKGN